MIDNSLKVEMTDELYSQIETGQAGHLNIINNFFHKINIIPSTGGSINVIKYFEPDRERLGEILETEIISEADRDYEKDYGNDYKKYIAVVGDTVHFMNSSSFGYSDIPKFVGDSLFQKNIFPDFIAVIIDRQYHDSEEYPRYDIEIHKIRRNHLKKYFYKRLANEKEILRYFYVDLNWFTRKLINKQQSGRYNILNKIGTELFRIDHAYYEYVVDYFFCEKLLSEDIGDRTIYFGNSDSDNQAFELWGRNVGQRIFAETLPGDTIVALTPIGNLDRNGCQGQKYEAKIYKMTKSHLEYMYSQKKAMSERLPNVTLSDIVKSSNSSRKFLVNNPHGFIRTGLFVSYGFDTSPFFEYINSKHDTVLLNEADKSVSFENISYERDGHGDNEKFERALKNLIGLRFSLRGYSHKAVVWSLYNKEKVPEGWTLPKVVR